MPKSQFSGKNQGQLSKVKIQVSVKRKSSKALKTAKNSTPEPVPANSKRLRTTDFSLALWLHCKSLGWVAFHGNDLQASQMPKQLPMAMKIPV